MHQFLKFIFGIELYIFFVDDKPTWRTKFLKYIYLSTTLYRHTAKTEWQVQKLC
jgi:hypothetical protein